MRRHRPWTFLAAGIAAAAAIATARSRIPSAGAETRGPGGVVLFDAREVAEAFSAGKMLLAGGEYKVMAGHRDKGGIPEVHDADTDIFYILAGEASFVTGGKVIDPRTESPGETRGSGLEGGQVHRLKKGNIIIIPRGVPHWFSEVPKLVDYLVVKVTAPGPRDPKPGK